MTYFLIGLVIGVIVGIFLGNFIAGTDYNYTIRKIKQKRSNGTIDVSAIIKQKEKKKGLFKRLFTKKRK